MGCSTAAAQAPLHCGCAPGPIITRRDVAGARQVGHHHGDRGGTRVGDRIRIPPISRLEPMRNVFNFSAGPAVLPEEVLTEAAADVKAGLPVSEAFRKHPEIPGIVVAMIKIGEETGNMGNILDSMAKFYRRAGSGPPLPQT